MLQTWNPKSKNEPYALSAVELIKMANEAVEDFFEIPVGVTEDLIYDLAEGFDSLFKEYANLVAACGKKAVSSLFDFDWFCVFRSSDFLFFHSMIRFEHRIKTELSSYAPSSNQMQP